MTRPWRDAEVDEGDAGALVCSACRAPITDERHAIERGGEHAHTFVNPGGFVHHVRCFRAADGLAAVGGEERAFTWFPGYAWQIVECARCRGHRWTCARWTSR